VKKDAAGHDDRIRVLCVEDHEIVREGLVLIIDQEPDMEVVGSAVSAEEALLLFRRLRPTITLMDLRLRGSNGVDGIVAIRREDSAARVIVLTMYDGDEDIYRALQAGAATYLNKDILSQQLIRVIRQVHAGERPLAADIRARLDERLSHPALTAREIEVLELVACGMRNKEVAASLAITKDTVVVHLRNIFVKLDVNDRTTAVRIAIRRGMIHGL
jgi:DNA-binding NarL/FixJ family response regulator